MSGLLGNIGTLRWCRATHGVLSRSERTRYIAAVLIETLRHTPRALLYKAGLRGRGPDPASFSPPDSVAVRRVLEACAKLEPMLVEHSYRSYLFARALGVRDHLECDDEALFVATMLHDLGFPSAGSSERRCFGLEGAERAEAILRRTPLPAGRRNEILDAITLHLNPRVGLSQGVIPHLMHAGVMVDVVGVRAWELSPQGVDKVMERHPRHRFIHRGMEGWRFHRGRVPESRVHQLLRCGFSISQRVGPWYAHETRSLP